MKNGIMYKFLSVNGMFIFMFYILAYGDWLYLVI